MEIFAKALEYAKSPDLLAGGFLFPDHIEDAGAKRLHAQAKKILKMAISRAENLGVLQGSDGFQAAVCEQIGVLQKRYGDGWKKENDGWCYKDFDKEHELTDVLIFLREIGVHWKQLDQTDIGTAMHLRMPPELYDVVFNPSTHVLESDKAQMDDLAGLKILGRHQR